MVLPEVYILRHGETAWNREGRLQGKHDSALTDLGLAQGRAMGRHLAALGLSPRTHDLWTSPQGRAQATAALVAEATGLIARPDPRLAEIGIGDWAGLTRAEVDRRWPGPPDEGFLGLYARAPKGEPLAALAARAGAFLTGLTRPAVIVTHGMTSRALRAAALEQGLAEVAGGQGVIHHLADGHARRLIPDPALAQGLDRI